VGDPEREDRASQPTRPGGKGSSESATVVDRVSGARLPQATDVTFDPPADRFEERGELGRGGMGVVVEAYDRALGRPVAVKYMLSSSDVDRARFAREAQITARLEHPGIVPIHDAGRSPDGTPYYVMRRIDGEPLDKLVAGKSFSERITCVPNVLAACDAAAFAHARRVIHRDIKPSNILIGPFGETLLIDWGLARTIGDAPDVVDQPVSDPALTRVGVVAGTPGFMAPEQARGEKLDPRADVFALGATLFFVLAGDIAYSVDRPTEMVNHVGADRPPDWRRLPEETPRDLRAIVEKAMATRPADRYADAGELAADLRRFVTGHLVGAYRYGRIVRMRRFVRRHKAAVTVGLIALVVISLVAMLSLRRVLAERDDAKHAREIAEAQKREATATSDRMLVQSALHLVDADPAAALAWLRKLAPGSTQWARAASVAAAAAAQGVPFGFRVERETAVIDFSPDSRHLLAKGYRGGRILVFDVVARERRAEISADLLMVRWIDERWMVGAFTKDLRQAALIDSTTGAIRRIALPAKYAGLTTDRRSHAWLRLVDGSVFALDPTTQALPATPLLTDVIDMQPLGENRAVVARSSGLEVWTPARTFEVPGTRGRELRSMLAGANRVAVHLGKELCVWQLVEPPVLQICIPNELDAPLSITERAVFLYGPDGVSTLHTKRSTILPGGAVVSATPTGIAIGTSTGKLILNDSHGGLTIGMAGHVPQRFAQSDDERFLAAATNTGELLLWDLPSFRPVELEVEHGEQLFAITRNALWTLDISGATYRYARSGGERQLVFEGGVTTAEISADERWLLIYDEMTRTTTFHDLHRHATFPLGPGGVGTFNNERPIALAADGMLSQLQTDGTTTRLGSFGFAATSVSAARGHAVAAGERHLCRMKLSDASVACTDLSEPVVDHAVTAAGIVWVLAGTRLWRWDGVTAPVELPTTDPVRRLFWTGDTVVAQASASVIVLTERVPRFVPIAAMRQLGPATSDRLLGMTPHDQMAAIDLTTAISYVLPIPLGWRNGTAATDGQTVAGMISRTERGAMRTFAMLWDFRVPSEPAALRRWLETATNASLGPADVLTWP
jgi:predicted Ser/Thr protein kinase